MKNKLILSIVFLLLFFGSCTNLQQPNKYSDTFKVGGYYCKYDGVHYKYNCSNSETVKQIILYYYPDAFDIKVYNPGTAETGYLNTIFYATWLSYY